MKQVYVRPTMVSEVFTANEYVAACGDSGTVYKFVCDKPGSVVYCDKDGDGVADRIGGYSACGKTHEVSSDEVFKRGFVDASHGSWWAGTLEGPNGKEDPDEAAYIWLEYDRRGNITNWHATANLDMNSWETAKS